VYPADRAGCLRLAHVAAMACQSPERQLAVLVSGLPLAVLAAVLAVLAVLASQLSLVWSTALTSPFRPAWATVRVCRHRPAGALPGRLVHGLAGRLVCGLAGSTAQMRAVQSAAVASYVA
jgi:hypothetical protein